MTDHNEEQMLSRLIYESKVLILANILFGNPTNNLSSIYFGKSFEPNGPEQQILSKLLNPSNPNWLRDESIKKLQRNRISEWLRFCIRDSEVEDIGSKPKFAHRILDRLASRDINEAYREAILNDSPILASIINAAADCSSAKTRSHLFQQLENWGTTAMDAKMDDSILRIYSLCSGKSDIPFEHTWQKALGMFMWYNSLPVQNFPEIFHEFHKKMSSFQNVFQRP